jgi:hypothetical protein
MNISQSTPTAKNETNTITHNDVLSIEMKSEEVSKQSSRASTNVNSQNERVHLCSYHSHQIEKTVEKYR